jgi:hypothetical protein
VNVFLNGFGDVCIEDSFLLVCSTDNNLGITPVFFFSQSYHACSKSDNHLVFLYLSIDHQHFGHVTKFNKKNTESQCFCYWNFFVKFQPQKYDFNLNKGFLWEKWLNFTIFERFFFQIAIL